MRNFGKIKEIFNSLVIEGIIKKDESAKKLFKQYLKTIRESEILKTQFMIYDNIENKVDEDAFSANLFVSENIKLMEKFDKVDILRANNKLVKLLEKGGVKSIDDYESNALHESIANLIFTNRSVSNVQKITEDIKGLTNHILDKNKNIVTEKIETVEMPISFLTKFLVDKYNQEYSSLNEDDSQIVKVLIDSDLTKKQDLYNKFVSECKELVAELLKEGDTESKEKLLKVKNKLETESVINEDDFIAKVAKIVELKNNLKTN